MKKKLHPEVGYDILEPTEYDRKKIVEFRVVLEFHDGDEVYGEYSTRGESKEEALQNFIDYHVQRFHGYKNNERDSRLEIYTLLFKDYPEQFKLACKKLKQKALNEARRFNNLEKTFLKSV